MKCAICNNVILPLEPCGIISKDKAQMKICSKCDKAKKGLLNIEREEVEGSKKYFEQYLVQSNMNECVKGHIRDWIENAVFITDERVQRKERYEAVEKIYRENKSELLKFITTAKSVAQEMLIKNAVMVGGNAVVALNYDIVTFSNNLIGILVNGTAVKIKKIEC